MNNYNTGNTVYENRMIPEPPKVFSKNINFRKHKNYCCGRCLRNSFEIIASEKDILKCHVVCSHCKGIANEDIQIITDKHPSHILMSLKIRK